MDVNDNAGIQNERVAFEFIASKLAPTEKMRFVRWTLACFDKALPFQ